MGQRRGLEAANLVGVGGEDFEGDEGMEVRKWLRVMFRRAGTRREAGGIAPDGWLWRADAR